MRIEYAGASYHLMYRGAARRDIFPDDSLRLRLARLHGIIRTMLTVETLT